MEGTREELETYRAKVYEELRSRANRLKEIDGAIASSQYLLDGAGASFALRAGNTLRALVAASHKAKLKREVERLQRQRREAASDLKRAEERLADVDRELEELEQGQPGDGGDSGE